jgi:hypothetical protein
LQKRTKNPVIEIIFQSETLRLADQRAGQPQIFANGIDLNDGNVMKIVLNTPLPNYVWRH